MVLGQSDRSPAFKRSVLQAAVKARKQSATWSTGILLLHVTAMHRQYAIPCLEGEAHDLGSRCDALKRRSGSHSSLCSPW